MKMIARWRLSQNLMRSMISVRRSDRAPMGWWESAIIKRLVNYAQSSRWWWTMTISSSSSKISRKSESLTTHISSSFEICFWIYENMHVIWWWIMNLCQVWNQSKSSLSLTFATSCSNSSTLLLIFITMAFAIGILSLTTSYTITRIEKSKSSILELARKYECVATRKIC